MLVYYNIQRLLLLLLLSSTIGASDHDDLDQDNLDKNIQSDAADTADLDSETENFENEAGQFYKLKIFYIHYIVIIFLITGQEAPFHEFHVRQVNISTI